MTEVASKKAFSLQALIENLISDTCWEIQTLLVKEKRPNLLQRHRPTVQAKLQHLIVCDYFIFRSVKSQFLAVTTIAAVDIGSSSLTEDLKTQLKNSFIETTWKELSANAGLNYGSKANFIASITFTFSVQSSDSSSSSSRRRLMQVCAKKLIHF